MQNRKTTRKVGLPSIFSYLQAARLEQPVDQVSDTQVGTSLSSCSTDITTVLDITEVFTLMGETLLTQHLHSVLTSLLILQAASVAAGFF